MKYIVVYTFNQEHFRYWCQENNVNPHDKRVIFASDEYRLRGLHDCLVIRWGHFFKRPDHEQMELFLKIIEQKLEHRWEVSAIPEPWELKDKKLKNGIKRSRNEYKKTGGVSAEKLIRKYSRRKEAP